MSETAYVRCTRVGSNEVCRSSDGWAEIEPMHQGRSMGERITIMREDVPAVALALLGGLTDALVERVEWALNAPTVVSAADIVFPDWWSAEEIAQASQEEQRAMALNILQAIFGVEDGEPGSGQ